MLRRRCTRALRCSSSSRSVERFQYQGMRVRWQGHAGLGYGQLIGGFYFVLLKYSGQQDKPEPRNQLLPDARPFAGAKRQEVFRFPNARLRVGLTVDKSVWFERFRIVPIRRARVQFVIVNDYACAFGDFEIYSHKKKF